MPLRGSNERTMSSRVMTAHVVPSTAKTEAQIYTYVHTYTYSYAYIYIYIYIHTYTYDMMHQYIELPPPHPHHHHHHHHKLGGRTMPLRGSNERTMSSRVMTAHVVPSTANTEAQIADSCA